MIQWVKELVGELARPIAIISTSVAAAVATVRISWNISDESAGAVYIGAVFAGVAALYGAKAWENASVGKAQAKVEEVRAQASPPPAEALKPASPAPDDDRSLEDPA